MPLNRNSIISWRCGLLAALFAFALSPFLASADTVYSGPQRGEKTTPFKSVWIRGDDAGREIDVIGDNAGASTVLVFVHGLERSMLPLMRVVDQYGARHKDNLKTEYVFLAADRVDGMQRFSRALNSINLQGRSTLSIDGAEGPGNYGLNKECLLTIVAAKENRVHANFALVQPGIADGERVLGAIAKMIGDPEPPTSEVLVAEFQQRYNMNRRGGKRGPDMRDGKRPMNRKDGDPFPGAVPTDARLQGLLRQIIRKQNENTDVDRLIGQMREHAGGNQELRKQVVDGWTRVLHFDDRYGTEYARKQGRELMEELKKE